MVQGLFGWLHEHCLGPGRMTICWASLCTRSRTMQMTASATSATMLVWLEATRSCWQPALLVDAATPPPP